MLNFFMCSIDLQQMVSIFVQTYYQGKRKPSHLHRTRPIKRDPTFNIWDEEDWASMNPKITDNFMFLTIVHCQKHSGTQKLDMQPEFMKFVSRLVQSNKKTKL